MFHRELSFLSLMVLLCQHGVKAVDLITCEGQTASLTCAQGTINVLSANYGRTDRTTCSAGKPANQLSNVQCRQSTSLSVVTTPCNGKQSCSIAVRNTVFNDPCVGTYKYLFVSYECILPPPPSAPSTNLVTCESGTARLSCARGTIKVVSANYGRTDAATCSTGRPDDQLSNVQCTQSTSLSALTTQCDGKPDCSIAVNNAVFGDPCVGTYKYLIVSYKCILPTTPPPPSAPSTNLFTCESETAPLSCVKGTIKVLSANYGRTDQKTCSTGKPANQLSNVQCTQSTSLSVLTTQCDGKPDCSIAVNNAVFGDPCVGTYKYLNVSYTCVKAKDLITCEGETAKPSCAKGTIKVRSANYGRTNKTTCSTGRPPHQLSNVQCRQSTSLSVVAKQCDGKQDCSIPATNKVFSDPCVGTYKYLNVSYTCSQEIDLITCQGGSALLSCAQGTINVLSANYGRTDRTTCSSGRPSNQLSNVQCRQSTSLSVVTTRCDGQQSCSIVVGNAAFTEPCPGTYKYLFVSYECILPTTTPPTNNITTLTIFSSLTQVAPATNLVTCESGTARLSCAQGTISVLSANYGRTDSSTCSTGKPANQLSNVQCTQSTSLSVLTTQCDGQQICSIVVGNAAFNEPCPGTYKYLFVSYECILPTTPPPPTIAPSTNLVTCDLGTARLSCAQGTINVLSANYGRTDRTTCSSGRPSNQLSNVQCTQSTSLSVLTTRCDGKQSCSIVVRKNIFNDPCPGTYKYLFVSYECTTNLVTCESGTARLSCGHGTINVVSANYGRTDRTTCSSGKPANQLSNTQCTQSTSLSVVTTRCDGKPDCSISVNNAVFGDPCVGTYKYLIVSYTCVQNSIIICQGKSRTITCEGRRRIYIDFANYGRRDTDLPLQ
ncbi:uncharacterized protein LOC130409523 [Triplophysa dalaica]|uniref:uncharacterized protein LOC130409523 n=1 Tax=Triplophysa dalaica TaxID=1582913 RepID=UPI0024DF8401|nr:uncharacterized protein LOC130409523 [Triplophysa dalaica]